MELLTDLGGGPAVSIGGPSAPVHEIWRSVGNSGILVVAIGPSVVRGKGAVTERGPPAVAPPDARGGSDNVHDRSSSVASMDVPSGFVVFVVTDLVGIRSRKVKASRN